MSLLISTYIGTITIKNNQQVNKINSFTIKSNDFLNINCSMTTNCQYFEFKI